MALPAEVTSVGVCIRKWETEEKFTNFSCCDGATEVSSLKSKRCCYAKSSVSCSFSESSAYQRTITFFHKKLPLVNMQ